MWEGALKCLFRFLLRSEVTKGLNFILAASASAMATEGKSNILVLKNIYLTALGLSCPVACRSLVPEPGIKPVSPELEGRFLTTGPPGKSLSLSCLIVASFFDFDSRFLISEHLPVSLPRGEVVHQRGTCTFSTFCRAPNNTWATPMIIGSQGALLPSVEVL